MELVADWWHILLVVATFLSFQVKEKAVYRPSISHCIYLKMLSIVIFFSSADSGHGVDTTARDHWSAEVVGKETSTVGQF